MSDISKKDKFIANFMKHPIADIDSQQQATREEAYQALTKLEFPTLRTEAWKYTRIASILNGNYETKEAEEKWDKSYEIPDLEGSRLVFINGFFAQELSHIQEEDKLVVRTLAQARFEYPEVISQYFGKYADHNTEIFTALNTAFNMNGAFVMVEKNAIIEKPIHIVNIVDGEEVTSQPRNLFVAERGASVKIVHSIEEKTEGTSFTNLVSEIHVSENAELDYYILQKNGVANTHVQSTQVYQEANSRFYTGAFTLGGKLVRNDLNIVVDAEGCESNLYGTYVLNSKQHVDNHTVVDHKKPNCQSNENYKGIMDENSTGVFNGKVFVRPDAQQIQAYQNNQNILLSDSAVINSKPELEIYADDVKCSHGSTTGQLDEDALFYMMARGIDRERAQKLMIQAFVGDVVESVRVDALKEHLLELIAEKVG